MRYYHETLLKSLHNFAVAPTKTSIEPNSKTYPFFTASSQFFHKSIS